MKERLKKLKFVHFVPALAMFVAAAITATVYGLRSGNAVAPVYLAGVFATALIPIVFPLVFVTTGKNTPWFIIAAICAHVICAADLGTALRFYDMWGWWDLFCHGFFGFNAALVVFTILADCKGVKLSPVWMILLAFSAALALGALWEIVEYITDRLFDSDSQRVWESLAEGKSPVADTMEDLMITVAGVAVFALFYFIDRPFENAAFRYLRLLPSGGGEKPALPQDENADAVDVEFAPGGENAAEKEK